MNEMVVAVDALSREVLGEVFRGVLGSGPALASMSTVAALGPLRSFLLPLPTPIELISRWD